MARFKYDDDSEDADKDGVSDIFEIMVLKTDPWTADTDGDGLSDGRERDFGSNPVDADTDDDGMRDGREVTIGTSPNARDTDQDGIDDRTEAIAGTAHAPDADRDGTPDWVEVARDGHDEDGDTLTDADERWLRTNPLADDTDGDGTPDRFEVDWHGDPRTWDAPDAPPPPRPRPEMQVPDGPYEGGRPEIQVPSGPFQPPPGPIPTDGGQAALDTPLPDLSPTDGDQTFVEAEPELVADAGLDLDADDAPLG